MLLPEVDVSTVELTKALQPEGFDLGPDRLHASTPRNNVFIGQAFGIDGQKGVEQLV